MVGSAASAIEEMPRDGCAAWGPAGSWLGGAVVSGPAAGFGAAGSDGAGAAGADGGAALLWSAGCGSEDGGGSPVP
ncbi:MAG TPA: hypothetical protein VEJ84_02805 [Acidimicrobiales bacterium]|nr:hypothetical protein [Acidimicrobiales bacterium]